MFLVARGASLLLCFACFVDMTLEETARTAQTLGTTGVEQDDELVRGWDSEEARLAVEDDVRVVLTLYDERQASTVQRVILDYGKTNTSDIVSVARWGYTLSKLLELSSATGGIGGRVCDRLVTLASSLARSRQTLESFVEQRVLRGWPIYLSDRDPWPTFDSHQFGHIALTISLGARAAAVRGDHDLAADLVQSVTEAMWDNFFSYDLEQTKLDSLGRVVAVPRGASHGRTQRYRQVTNEKVCLHCPVALNKGIMLARAAAGVLRAMDAVDWQAPGAAWKAGSSWPREECYRRLAKLVQQHEAWLLESLVLGPGTGSSPKDSYLGPRGAEWYLWKYRDCTSCSEYQGSIKDRFEDIAHARNEIAFVRELGQLYADAPILRGAAGRRLGRRDIARMMVTFLNRVIHNRNAVGGARFACDVAGTFDGDPGSDKQCGRKRNLRDRAYSASNWLQLAFAAKQELLRPPPACSDGLELCPSQMELDMLQMVNDILPVFTTDPLSKGAEFSFSRKQAQNLHKWAANAIEAKYHFYQHGVAVRRLARPAQFQSESL